MFHVDRESQNQRKWKGDVLSGRFKKWCEKPKNNESWAYLEENNQKERESNTSRKNKSKKNDY